MPNAPPVIVLPMIVAGSEPTVPFRKTPFVPVVLAQAMLLPVIVAP